MSLSLFVANVINILSFTNSKTPIAPVYPPKRKKMNLLVYAQRRSIRAVWSGSSLALCSYQGSTVFLFNLNFNVIVNRGITYTFQAFILEDGVLNTRPQAELSNVFLDTRQMIMTMQWNKHVRSPFLDF